jgi:diaminohydroxyphosphoribosylaminopyrimidine deaminase/5-amino-6-(5-phosphoribosylamino)uracil reductase
MADALALAEQGFGLTDPNPRVGCVLTRPDGQVLGRGHTQQAGGPHAEVMALRDARAHGASDSTLRGATAYVTLEPCAHHGRTPPCVEALLAAGIGRAVVALRDPFPQVAGHGLARLAAAGVQVELGLGAKEALEQNPGFFSRVLRQRPWVRMKVAVSLDGRTALPDGRSQWITGEAARRDGHAWRRRAGAVLTGSGTLRQDDPRLDVRLVPTARQPLRVLLSSRLTQPPAARLLQPPGPVWIYTRADSVWPGDGPAIPAVPTVPSPDGIELRRVRHDPAGTLALDEVLEDLARSGINELHLEAGATLNGAFVRADLIDEWLVYLAPMLVGEGRGLADIGRLPGLDAAPRLRLEDVCRLGEDLRLRARPPGRDAWLRALAAT